MSHRTLAELRSEKKHLERYLIYTPRDAEEREAVAANLDYSRRVGDLFGIQLSMQQLLQANQYQTILEEIELCEARRDDVLSNADFAELVDILEVGERNV